MVENNILLKLALDMLLEKAQFSATMMSCSRGQMEIAQRKEAKNDPEMGINR